MSHRATLLLDLTWSKIMALLMLGCSVYLGATSFMFAVPFVSALILGKQYFDKDKPLDLNTNK